eukprot:TRINITY_DN12799_c0_g1_i1.p1 TRINITY_DN12799_c0_g1~~TRINITY_DN12799_c0_g1_i1.p1  ORF type:complete len:328 (+),score=59.04 TRINITY_DN12799_c0_g1_i1:32-985(+)
MKLVVKISYGNDIRRIPIYSDTDLYQFKCVYYELFRLNDDQDFLLFHSDEKIHVRHEEDWNRLMEFHFQEGTKVVRLFVEKGKGDEIQVTPFLKRFFNNMENQSWSALLQSGRDLLRSNRMEDWETAKEMFFEMSTIQPFHPVPLFYTACAESLLGNEQSALQYLENSIHNGFEEFDKLKDKIFENLKNSSTFKNLLSLGQKDDVKPRDSSPRNMQRLRKWTVLESRAAMLQQNITENRDALREIYKEQLSLRNLPTTFFNLTVLESPCNPELALQYLEKAVESGFKDFVKLTTEPRLNNIKGTTQFQTCLAKIQRK